MVEASDTSNEKTTFTEPALTTRVSRPGATQALIIAALCLVLAFAAQRSLDQAKSAGTGVLLYAVAAVAFALTMRGTAVETHLPEADETEVRTPPAWTVVLSLGVALVGCLDMGDNLFRPAGLALWLGGLLVLLRYLGALSAAVSLGARTRAWLRERGVWIPARWLLLLAVVLLGAWLRLYRLDKVPADLGPDLIYHYYDTLDILQGTYRIHFPERESLLFYLTALCAKAIGLGPYTLFLTSALIGTATIVGLYLLGREVFGPQIGLLAALLLAINRWHLTLSRSAYPAVLTPLAAILLLYTLVRALRRRQFIDFAWCGVQLGLGFYTYTPYKAMPLFVLLALALYGLARGRARLRPLGSRVLLLFAVAVVVAAPLIRFAVEHPHEYFVREEVALRLKREQAAQDPGLPTYVWRTLLGLNYRGDRVQRWNYPDARHMGWVSGALMVLGLAYALWRWRHGYNVLLVSAWFVLLLPAALGMLPGDSASSLRMSGMLGPAVLLAALPLAVIAQALREVWARTSSRTAGGDTTGLGERTLALTIDSAARHYAWSWRPTLFKVWLLSALAVAVGLGMLWFEGREAYRFYFRDFVSRAPDRMNYSNAREVAREIEHYGDLGSVYVKIWQYWFDARALWANLGLRDQTWAPWVETLDPQQPPLSTIQGSVLFIVHADDREGLATLRASFPRGVAIVHRYPDGVPSFYTFHGQR